MELAAAGTAFNIDNVRGKAVGLSRVKDVAVEQERAESPLRQVARDFGRAYGPVFAIEIVLIINIDLHQVRGRAQGNAGR